MPKKPKKGPGKPASSRVRRRKARVSSVPPFAAETRRDLPVLAHDTERVREPPVFEAHEDDAASVNEGDDDENRTRIHRPLA